MKPHLRITHKGKVVKVAVKEAEQEKPLILNEPKGASNGKLPDALIIAGGKVKRAWAGERRDEEPRPSGVEQAKKK